MGGDLFPSAAVEPLLFSFISGAVTAGHLKQSHALLYRLCAHESSYLVSKILRRAADLHRHLPRRYAPLVFSQVPRPNSFLWTSLIRFSAIVGPPSPHPLFLYSLMRRASPSTRPLSFTFSALLKSSSAEKSFIAGVQLHANIVAVGGFNSDYHVQNTLLDFYVQCGCLTSARKVFDQMSERDSVSWTSLIVAYWREGNMSQAEELFEQSPEKDMVAWTAMVTGYAQNARPKEAVEAFERMREAGFAVDEVSLSAAVSACGQLGSSKKVALVLGIAENSGLEKNVVVGSAMVDMYGKCGLIGEARRVFDGMKERNVYTFSAMIAGLAVNGRAVEAIELFEEMTAMGKVEPNWVTFLGVLTACSHAGKVEEGRRFFRRMWEEHEIQPNADHYACMVDMLGRAGLVEEALELASSEAAEPNAGVWGALLGACRLHGKPNIAKIAAGHLMKLEPNSVGNYVLLSNTFAEAGMWDRVSEVRKTMQRRGLKKSPASSFVEDRDGSRRSLKG